MKVYGLYGKSGTGKSHKAFQVLEDFHINAIIDDGLLIIHKRKIAGISAKSENSPIAATKRAIFFSDSHRDEIVNAIKKHYLPAILIIGTSKKMIHKIVDRLKLSDEITWIPIENYQTTRELVIARERRSKNQHVIPIHPSEKETTFYRKWFRESIILRGKKREEILVVKPVYQQKNKIIIYPQCIKDLVTALSIDTIQIQKVRMEFEKIVLTVSTKEEVTLTTLIQWRDHLVTVINQTFKKNYTVDLHWQSILMDKKSIISKLIKGRKKSFSVNRK